MLMKHNFSFRSLIKFSLALSCISLTQGIIRADISEIQDLPFLFSIEDEKTRDEHDIAQLAPPSTLPQVPNSNAQSNVVPNIEQTEELQDATDANESRNIEESEARLKPILINFNNVAMTEYIRFVSRISNKNFIFNENDLAFNVTIVSEEPATIENIMMALLQELRIHDLSLIEQGNSMIIHRNPGVNGISAVVSKDLSAEEIIKLQADIITQVFRLNTVNAEKAGAIIKPLASTSALIEILESTNQLIITDISSNIIQIGKLLKSLDSPQTGLVVGQYVVKQGVPDALINLTQQIMQPIAIDQSFTMAPHAGSNSIFIVASPYLVERALSIMQYLDQTQGSTQILNLKGASFQNENGQWELDENGNWRYRTGIKETEPPKGYWSLDSNGNWKFNPDETAPPGENWIKDANGNWVRDASGRNLGGPRSPDGKWVKDTEGNWIFQLAPGKPISPERITRKEQTAVNLPIGHIERTKFYIYRLHHRQASLIEQSLRNIGASLKETTINADLVAAIDTIQSIEATNALIFTGTTASLDKLKELIEEIDHPLRQVFLELLILETNLTDALTYGVNWGSGFGGGNSAGAQAFLSAGSPLSGALATAIAPSLPNAASLARGVGYNLGVLGQHLTHGGLLFNSIGALVSAFHNTDLQKIVLNPKILTEDNSPAEIFVGINTPYPTQSIANNDGNIVTQNFEYLDVGVRFKVTPLIGDNDMITLDIEEEKTDIIATPNQTIQQLINPNVVTGPTTSKSKTTTRVHMPNGYFLILSGQIQDKITTRRGQIPCLGGIPLLGGAFSDRRKTSEKTNLLVFIRPLIIDTHEEMHNITKHQQDIWKNKNRLKSSWKYETQEALEFFNLREELWPNYDTDECERD